MVSKNKQLEQSNSELESQIEVLQINGLSQQFVEKLETKINETAPLKELEEKRRALAELESKLKVITTERNNLNDEKSELSATKTNLTKDLANMTSQYHTAERRVEDLTRMLEAKPGTPMPPIIDEKEI